MSRRTIVLGALLFFVVALVGWLVFALGGASKSNSRPADHAPVALDTSVDTPRHEVEALAPLASDSTTSSNSPTSTTRAVAVAQQEEISSTELANAFWVEGHVKFPDGTPVDERAVVVGVGKEFGSKKLHRATVGPDGRFKVAFSKATKKATLRLEARYLFLEESLPVKPETQPKDVELVARLGGAVRGKLLPSANAQPFTKDLVGITLSANGWKMGGGMPRSISGKVDENLEFELGGFDPEMNWSLSAKPKGFVAIYRESLATEKGTVQPLDLEVQRGARFSGIVRDEQGAPIAKAAVTETSSRMNMDFMGRERTKEDGRYDISGVSAGKAILVAECDGYVSRKMDPIEVKEGDEHPGFDIVLSRGNSVAGLVQWPDGKPAPDVRVEVEYAPGNEVEAGSSFFGDKPNAKTAGDGTFVITGLGKGPFTVSARSSLKEVPMTTATAKSGKKTQKVRFSAELEGVAENAKGLVLALASGSSVTGTVVDDVNAPIEEFRVIASPAHQMGVWNNGDDIARSFAHKDGKFELLGLADGEWEIRAEVKKGSVSARQHVTIPGDIAPLTLVCARTSVIAGSVVTPDGKLVEGATIVIRRDGSNDYWRIERENAKGRRTDAEGQFRCANVPPGKLKVHATHTDWAPSESQSLDVVAAQSVGPLVLTLRRGGTIAGQTLDPKGKPSAGRMVYAWGEGFDGENATSRADGSFELKHVTPGKLTLNMQPTQADLAASRDDRGNYDWNGVHVYNSNREVIVVDGETVNVVLGGAPPNPVKLVGIVRNAKPLEGAQVQATLQKKPGDRSNAWSSPSAKTKADGHYEIQLDEPGDYSVQVTTKSGVQMHQRKAITGPTFTLDFVLPDGRISGRVVTALGKPVPNCSVNTSGAPSTKEKDDSVSAVQSGSTRTDAEGKFAFDALSPGVYTLDANPREYGFGENKASTLAKARLQGLKLEAGANLDGIEVVLAEGGVVQGIVRGPKGEPLEGAHITVRGENGEPLNQPWSDETDSAGRFRVVGLAPQKVAVSARNDTLVSPEVAAVVRANEDTEVPLTMQVGGFLRVKVFDAAGAMTGAGYDVRDSKDHSCSMELTFSDEEESLERGRRCGPLLPGSYTVRTWGAKSAVVSAQVSAGSEREVELRQPE